VTGNRALQDAAASCSGAVPSTTGTEDRGVAGGHSRISVGRKELDPPFQKRFPYTLKETKLISPLESVFWFLKSKNKADKSFRIIKC